MVVASFQVRGRVSWEKAGTSRAIKILVGHVVDFSWGERYHPGMKEVLFKGSLGTSFPGCKK